MNQRQLTFFTTGERKIESGKLPFRKEVGLQFPHGMSLSVFLPTLMKMDLFSLVS